MTSNSGGSGNSGYDNSAAIREQQRLEAERRAEEQRKREAELEQQRIDAENKRLSEEAATKAKFIEDRDATLLRGSTGISITPNKSSGTGLRGALHDTGLRGSQPVANKEQGQQAVAWKQLHCVSALTGFALTALKNGDNQEFDLLIREASTKFDGGRPNVECPSAPAMPDLKGSTVNMEQLQGKQKELLDRATKIADRMKQADAKLPEAQTSKPAPANETELEKTVRVQRELNKINSGKVANEQQEKDRKELARLLLINNGLEKGELIDVIAKTTDDAPKPKGQRKREPPSPNAR